MPATIDRIGPQQAKREIASGALFVCGYDDDDKCRQNHLDGSIAFSQFKKMENSFPKDREIIFYCA